MVERRRGHLNVRDLARLLGALADPTRLKILQILSAQGEVIQKEIVAMLRRPQGTVARHLAALRQSGYVNVRRDGRYTHWTGAPMPKAVAALIKQLAVSHDVTPQWRNDDGDGHTPQEGQIVDA